jgi:4-hydroxythreonine-4-phosphate dehydrogenase
MSRRPRIALLLGDPAGIGPELVARLLANPDNRRRARMLVVGDAAELDEAMRIAAVHVPTRVVTDAAELAAATDDTPGLYPCVVSRGGERVSVVRAETSADAGRYALETLAEGLALTVRGVTDAVCFAPLNKASLHAAGLGQADEGQWFRARLDVDGPVGELNVLDGLTTSRVTSHVPLRAVADLITEDGIVAAVRLVHRTLVSMGVADPRIVVCGLNPHAGDQGNFGREEIEVIAPAIARATAEGYACAGPYPADTIFLKARQVDAIVTMYHDQGQIAMKLLGFSRGVTFYGGLPIPIATPAHGTAFDIYGRGVANPGAMQAAFDLLCRIVEGTIASEP